MWNFAERFDLQMAVQSSRSVARSVVARLVAEGARNTHEWTPEKHSLFDAFDQSGITSVFMEPEYGGFIEGPKNMALALTAFELSWVDGGAATCSLATNLALAPIHERGTPEQRKRYMSLCTPPQPGENRKIWRGAFALTEPLPFVGVDTGVVGGKVRVNDWKDGKEPMLHVDKRGRFITNMAFANFVTAAVDSDDPRIKGSCMIILEEGDPGSFDHGVPTRKMVHQLSATNDPVISVDVPASRIIGGYTVKDGVIIPNYSHGEVIEAVFLRTRVAPGLMTAAKLLSAVEPVIRYQRQRFHGGAATNPGTPRYDLGLQQKEDAVIRLLDVWATGEAAAALGFATAQMLDEFEPVEKIKNDMFAAKGIKGGRSQLKALSGVQAKAMEYLNLLAKGSTKENDPRIAEYEQDPMVKFVLLDAQVNVLCPAVKLWGTGFGTNMMREAVSLMGGYGITEDCPGFLAHKWMDAQLEATYEGPEAVQRRQLSATMTSDLFLAQMRLWIKELRAEASEHPGTGACALAKAFELWDFTLQHLMKSKDAYGKPLYHSKRQGVTFMMADAISWLLASRYQMLALRRLEEQGPNNPSLAEGLEGYIGFFTDLCHVQCARASGEVSRICSALVFGYNRHPAWDAEGIESCHQGCLIDEMEGIMPGLSAGARSKLNVVEEDGSHPRKAGPCVCTSNYDAFIQIRSKMDGCLTGSYLARDRAADALTGVMIPEALDYPA